MPRIYQNVGVTAAPVLQFSANGHVAILGEHASEI
jgi:hypothetical protein